MFCVNQPPAQSCWCYWAFEPQEQEFSKQLQLLLGTGLLLILACHIPEEFGRNWCWTLLLCDEFVLREQRKRVVLVLATAVDNWRNWGPRFSYLMLTVLFSDRRKVAPRTDTEYAVQCLYTVAQLRRLVLCVVSKSRILLPMTMGCTY
jgi:hypothetical protein